MKKYYVTLRKLIVDLINKDGNADGCQEYVKVYSQGPSIADKEAIGDDVFDTQAKASDCARSIRDANTKEKIIEK